MMNIYFLLAKNYIIFLFPNSPNTWKPNNIHKRLPYFWTTC